MPHHKTNEIPSILTSLENLVSPEFSDRQKEVKIWLENFSQRLIRISDTESYAYDEENYQSRLLLEDQLLREILRKELFSGQKIDEMYAILNLIQNSSPLWESLKDSLYELATDYSPHPSVVHTYQAGFGIEKFLLQTLKTDKIRITHLNDLTLDEWRELLFQFSHIVLDSFELMNLEESIQQQLYATLTKSHHCYLDLWSIELDILDRRIFEKCLVGFQPLRGILFGNNRVEDFSPDTLNTIFTHTQFLQEIDFGRTHLLFLDEEKLAFIFSHLPNLKRLNLSNSGLGKMTQVQLSAVFSHLPHIRSLNLSSNNLWTWKPQTFDSLSPILPYLKHLDLSGNDLGRLDSRNLKDFFSQISGIRSLNLSSNQLWILSKTSLSLIFSSLNSLRSLSLGNNLLNQWSSNTFFMVFWWLWDLKNLDISQNSLGKCKEAVFEMLFYHLENILSLNFDYNFLLPSDVSKVFSPIDKYASNLQSLSLINCWIDREMFSEYLLEKQWCTLKLVRNNS